MRTGFDVAETRSALLAWYRRHRRELPWRASGDPYAVWVSEIMLQQTQVATVVPYYRGFLERFPTVEALASASEDDVLAAWSGLGYYRRARALREGALAVVRRHGGRLPADPAALRELPGVGRYTAGAIASIAFDLPEPVLDGNVRRVLARLGAEPAPAERDLWAAASALVEGPSPGDLNQALMELGATVCTPRAPRCEACPLASRCAGRSSGRPDAFPAARPRSPSVRVAVAVAVVARGAVLLLEAPASDSPFRGRLDVPAIEVDGSPDPVAALRSAIARRHGFDPGSPLAVGSAAHGILNRRLRLAVHRFEVANGTESADATARWASAETLGDLPISGATRKSLGAVSEPRRSASPPRPAGTPRSRRRATAAARGTSPGGAPRGGR